MPKARVVRPSPLGDLLHQRMEAKQTTREELLPIFRQMMPKKSKISLYQGLLYTCNYGTVPTDKSFILALQIYLGISSEEWDVAVKLQGKSKVLGRYKQTMNNEGLEECPKCKKKNLHKGIGFEICRNDNCRYVG